MNYLSLLMADSSGNPSMMRLVHALVHLIILSVWAWVSVRQGSLAPVDPEIMVLLLGANGIKAFQRKVEGDQAQQKPTSPPTKR